MSILRIYFSSTWRDSSSPCPWGLCDEKGIVLESGTAPLAAMPKTKECIAIIAPDRVLSARAKLPPKSRRRWQEALRFVAEEFTLPDPESNHVVPGPALADGYRMLAVVDKSWLKRIVEACRTANLSLRRMIPETFLPPVKPETWTLVWDGTNGFLRTGAASGMALDNGDTDTPPLSLQLNLNSAQNSSPASAPSIIEVCFPQHIPEAERILPNWSLLNSRLAIGAVWDWRHATIPSEALNLLWGDFAPSTRVSELWPQFRPIALIMLAVLVAETLGANIEWAMLAQEKKTLTQDMERSFHTAFGEGHTLVNAALQMQRNLSELRHTAGLSDDGDFLPLLDAAAPTFASLPAGSLQGLHYEAGRLDADLKLTGKIDFQTLQQRLRNKGLGVQLSDIHDAGNGAEARLTLLPGDDR
jgi:general secretion pathway protein L